MAELVHDKTFYVGHLYRVGYLDKKNAVLNAVFSCFLIVPFLFVKVFHCSVKVFQELIALTGRNLELDCYNEDLKIACEYNGRQHYEFLKHFHGTMEDFHKQKRNDQKTRENCIKNGIFLIEVPYTVKVPDIERFIVNKLSQSGLV